MTIIVTLPPEAERKLAHEAAAHGIPMATYAARLIEAQLAQAHDAGAISLLLQTWIDTDDQDEQKKTGEYLTQALDEHRMSDRPLYPADLCGKTW